MTEAQEIFDKMVAPASPEELKAPKLHVFLNDEKIKSLTHGGKGVGSQGDGSIQFLAKDAVSQASLCDYLRKKGLKPYQLTISPQHKIKKAVIPVAGYGTRLYPVSRWTRKEMVPLIDKDGLLKPALLILLEQLIEARIEEICLIVGREDDVCSYQDFFRRPLAVEHFNKLPEEMRKYEDTLKNIGDRICYRVQYERRGFGHAVYQCRDFCAGESFLLLLGDTVYSSTKKQNCTQQFIEMYEMLEKPLIAIHKIDAKYVNTYGILSGNWADEQRRIMDIKAFIEKPDLIFAEKELVMRGVGDGKEYFSVFGQDILSPEVFNVLQSGIEKETEMYSEINMTDALNTFIGKGLTGVVLDGCMYDIGNPAAYWDAFSTFGKISNKDQ
jgi:UTP-glucose-1-phosphate uridylyltransferase